MILHENPDWLASEFRNNRVRFGWSWPGCDLREIESTPRRGRSQDQAISWRYAQFLTQRLKPGDRVVCQFDQPLREFWIGEVTSKHYEFAEDPGKDFNHILHINALTTAGIPVDAQFVPKHLRHDLSKRGHYYEIYPQESVDCLDRLLRERPWDSQPTHGAREIAHEFSETNTAVREKVVTEIRQRWRAKDFERFCAQILESCEHVEIHSTRDSGDGWDLLVRLLDPVTGSVLIDNIGVQCKNYEGKVDDDLPIRDLERCVNHESTANIAYLFILGDLTPSFRKRLLGKQEELSGDGRNVEFHVVDETRIAELCLAWMNREARGAGS